ncbi:MAG TPA: HIT family protein [Spirochaetia bacterium]|nr:HIT family protein [Spirochaetia bacterium]
MSCPFCNHPGIILDNDLAFAAYDRYPVTPGHMLIIPKRHFLDFFQCTDQEKKAISDMLDQCKNHLDQEFQPDGYNIGINCGEAAGQTVFHLHVHFIPRYRGDIENPHGGVRGVIPEKRIYR